MTIQIKAEDRVRVLLSVQRTNRGWMQQPGARDQAQGEQRNYALGRVVDVTGQLYELNGTPALDLLFAEGQLTPAQRAEFDPFVLRGLIKQRAQELTSAGEDEKAAEILSYLQPRPVSLIGSTVRVSSLPISKEAFERGGFSLNGLDTGRPAGRRQRETQLTLEKGLGEIYRAYDTASVFIEATVHPLVNSRKLLETGDGPVQSLIFGQMTYLKVEPAVGMGTTEILSTLEVAAQQAGARARRVDNLRSMSLGAGGRVGLTPTTQLSMPQPTEQTPAPPAQQAKPDPDTEKVAVQDASDPDDFMAGDDTSVPPAQAGGALE